MTSHETPDQPAEEGRPATSDRFERAATVIGALDSPFYDEERHRDVWNEASAIGFQTMLWGIPIVASALLWVGTVSAMPYVAALLAPWVLAMITTLTYARRRAVDPDSVEALSDLPGRALLFGVVMAALASGFLRAGLHLEGGTTLDRFLRGAAQGASGAFVIVALVAIGMAVRQRFWRRT